MELKIRRHNQHMGETRPEGVKIRRHNQHMGEIRPEGAWSRPTHAVA